MASCRYLRARPIPSWVRVCLVALAVVAPASRIVSAEPSNGKPVINIGIVHDGRAPGTAEEVPERLVPLFDLVESETLSLIASDFDVRFPPAKRVSGQWNLAEIRSAIDRLMADPEVDVVLALGIFSTNEVCRRKQLEKPVIAPFAVDVQTQALPRTLDTDGRMISGVANLNYLTTPGTILRDLREFRSLVPFSRVHVLTDALFMEGIPELPGAVIAGGRELGIDIAPPVLVVDSAEQALAGIPEDAEAVYVTPLHRMAPREFERLVQGLTRRKLPSFSLIGHEEVVQGVMAGVRPETDFARLARRIALNVQRILLGENAGDLPVTLELQEKLVINMATATSIGFFPSLRVAMEAELIQLGNPIEETLSLSQAVREAVAANVDLRATARDLAVTSQNVPLARSLLKPQVGVSAFGLQVDEDRAAASFGSQAETTVAAGLSLTQILYSNGLRANLAISKDLLRSAEFELEIRRLDVALDAANAFLNLLRAETLERVEQENVRLTQSNLELARRREQIGFSGPADVYRWESRLATNRASLLKAHGTLHQAFVNLNRVLHRPQEGLFESEIPSLADPNLLTGFGRLNPYVANAASFTLFKEFMVREGLDSSPELQSIDAAIVARERELAAARRSYWTPDLALVGDLERDISRSGTGSSGGSSLPFETADRTDWSVALQATLPLYRGGARRAGVRQADEQLAAIHLQRAAVVDRVQQRIRTALYNLTSSFPSIELAREAVDAARRNLELVTDSYARGVVSVIDLVDAQNEAVVSEAFAANAEFDFLLDLMELQRSTNRFDFFASDEARRRWFERLADYFEENAERIRWPKR